MYNILWLVFHGLFCGTCFSQNLSESTTSEPNATPTDDNLPYTEANFQALQTVIEDTSLTNTIVLVVSSFHKDGYSLDELNLEQWDYRYPAGIKPNDDDETVGRRRRLVGKRPKQAKAHVTASMNDETNKNLEIEVTPSPTEEEKLSDNGNQANTVLKVMIPKFKEIIHKISHPAFESATIKLKESESVIKDLDFSTDSINIKFITYSLQTTIPNIIENNNKNNNKNNNTDEYEHKLNEMETLFNDLSLNEIEYMIISFDLGNNNNNNNNNLNEILVNKVFTDTTYQALCNEIEEGIYDVFNIDTDVVWIYPLYNDNNNRIKSNFINLKDIPGIEFHESFSETQIEGATWTSNSSENIYSAKKSLSLKEESLDAKHSEKLLLQKKLNAHRSDKQMITDTISRTKEKIDYLKVQISGITPVVNELKETKEKREEQLSFSINESKRLEKKLININKNIDELEKRKEELKLKRKMMEKEINERGDELKNAIKSFVTYQRTKIIEATTSRSIHSVKKEQLFKTIKIKQSNKILTVLTCTIGLHNIKCGEPIISCKNIHESDEDLFDYDINQEFHIHYKSYIKGPKQFDFWVMNNDDCIHHNINNKNINNKSLTVREMIEQNLLLPEATYHCDIEMENNNNSNNINNKDIGELDVDCKMTNGSDIIEDSPDRVCLYVNCDKKLSQFVQLGATINVTLIDQDINDSENPMSAVKQEIDNEMEKEKQKQSGQETDETNETNETNEQIDEEMEEEEQDQQNQEGEEGKQETPENENEATTGDGLDSEAVDEEQEGTDEANPGSQDTEEKVSKRRLLQVGSQDAEISSSNENITSIITTILGVTFSVFALLVSFYWLYK